MLRPASLALALLLAPAVSVAQTQLELTSKAADELSAANVRLKSVYDGLAAKYGADSKKRLKEARAREYETFTVAVTALGEPMKARQRALHAQIEYEKAKWGNPDSDFKKVYDETVSLSGMQGGNYCDRAIRECIKPPLKYVLLGWPGGPVIHDNPFL